MHPQPSLLIGSTAGRLALQEETDWAYEESAKIDKIKDANKQQEESAQISIFNRHPKLREERAACVFQYHPLYCTQQLEVCHISVRVINPIFKDDSIMQNAYDWIGSLQEEPTFFCLMNMVEISC